MDSVGNEDGSDEEGGHIVFAGDGVCILSIQVAHRSLRICVVDVSRVQLLEGPRAVALSGPASHGLTNNVKVYSPVYLGWSDGFTVLGVIAIL